MSRSVIDVLDSLDELFDSLLMASDIPQSRQHVGQHADGGVFLSVVCSSGNPEIQLQQPVQGAGRQGSGIRVIICDFARVMLGEFTLICTEHLYRTTRTGMQWEAHSV